MYCHQLAQDLARDLKSHGFVVYLSDNGAGYYGCYTDSTKQRVISFSCHFETTFSGNYKSKRSGTGWRIDPDLYGYYRAMLEQNAPKWATSEDVKYTTLAEYLDLYQSSSKLKEK